jgi:hypothetical protein
MAKKYTKQQHAKHQKRHRIIVGLSIVVVAALLGLIFTLIVLPKIHNDARLHRINEIYSSIQLPQNVYAETNMIFGDKRFYSYDTNKTIPSTETFVVAKTVTDTFSTIDASIKAAGYTPLEQTNPDSVTKEGHYKTAKGEYIFLNVQSKLRLDAFQNEYWMGDTSKGFAAIDPNAGPSTVILKVNLDDNNE